MERDGHAVSSRFEAAAAEEFALPRERRNTSIGKGTGVRKEAWDSGSGRFIAVERLQFVVETGSWVAAWLLLPAWLGLRGASALDFLLYAVGAGLLLSFALALDRPEGFACRRDVNWFTAASILAVLFGGGFVFTIAAAVS